MYNLRHVYVTGGGERESGRERVGREGRRERGGV